MPPVFAFVVTAHGYGHAGRQMEVVRTLLGRHPGARAVVLSAVPASIFADYLGAEPGVLARVTLVPYRADVGLVQRDGLTTDVAATLRALDAAWGDAAAAERALAAALAEHRPAVVVGDIPPVAFGAAALLGVPSVAVGNFDWAWIYRFYAAQEPGFARWADRVDLWQAQATVAVQLTPGPPLTGFGRVVPGGLLARRLLVDASGVRAGLGVPPRETGHRAVLASFGGFGLRDAARRIPALPGVTWILAAGMEEVDRPDVRFARDVPYLALLSACDAVFTKPGYGIVSEAALARTRLLYTDRGDFPEYPWLVDWLTATVPAEHVPAADLGSERGPSAVAEGLARLFARPETWPDEAPAAARIAAVVEDLVGAG